VARVFEGGSTFDRISRADLCRIDVVSVFEAPAKNCVDIFFILEPSVEFLDDGCCA